MQWSSYWSKVPRLAHSHFDDIGGISHWIPSGSSLGSNYGGEVRPGLDFLGRTEQAFANRKTTPVYPRGLEDYSRLPSLSALFPLVFSLKACLGVAGRLEFATRIPFDGGQSPHPPSPNGRKLFEESKSGSSLGFW